MISGVSGLRISFQVKIYASNASRMAISYLQMNMRRMRLVYYTDSGETRSMEAPVDVVHQVQRHFADTVANREKGTD